MENNGVAENSVGNGMADQSASTTVNQDEQIMLQKQVQWKLECFYTLSITSIELPYIFLYLLYENPVIVINKYNLGY